MSIRWLVRHGLILGAMSALIGWACMFDAVAHVIHFAMQHSAMASAAEKNNVSEVKRLLEIGANPDAVGSHNIHPLMIAIEKGNISIFNLLLQHGAKVEGTDLIGMRPLHYAAGANKFAMAEVLIAKGANVRARASNGLTPLHLAAGCGSVPIARLLVKHGARINSPNFTKETPLMEATANNHKAMVEYLLANKASVRLKDNRGLTAESIAREKGYKDLVAMLHKR